jgi:putative salt-induced outer membrane protein YdiY
MLFRWRGNSKFLLAIAVVFSFSASSQQVILHLRNGDRLTGYITSESTNRVVLTNTWTKEIVIPQSAIVRRESIRSAATASTNAVTAPAITTTNTAAKPAKPPAAAPTVVGPKPPMKWTGELQLGADLGFSEKNRQLYTGKTKITMTYHRLRNTFDYNFAYGETESIISANRMEGSLKTDYDLTKRVYVYNLMGGGYDQIRKINSRYEVGPGLGYHLINRTNFVLNTEAGINYQAHYLADDTKTELFYYRLAENFTWRINSRFTLDEKFEFFPRVENWGVYRLRFESNLKYSILNNLFLSLSVLDQYDTDPAEGVGQNDLQVRSMIGVKF